MEEPIQAVPQPVQQQVQQPKQSSQRPVQNELPKQLVEDTRKMEEPGRPGRLDKLKQFITECKRVLRVTKKPNKEEFKTIVKVSALGMGVIGFIGFLVHFIKELLI